MSEKGLKTHKDLDVWNTAMDLVEKVYLITSRFPKEEQFGLVSQIKRSALSVPSNISEGAARNSKKEFIKFLYVAMGSLAELETQWFLAKRLNFCNEGTVLNEIELIRKMILGLIRSLREK